VRHSQNAALILGSGSKDVANGSELLGRVHPDDLPQVMAHIRGVSPSKPSYSVTFRFQRAVGEREVWLEVVATAQFAPDGSPLRIRGLTTDITERKRFEEEISRAQELAERADRAKSTFLAAASHDLRQPLQTLTSLHATLEQKQLDDESQDVVAGIGHSLDTMSGMLSSLLDINRLETGNLSPAKTDFAVAELFDSVATDLRWPLEEKGLQWRIVASDLVVHSDKRMLEEMLRNLLSNAIRYTDRGKILLGCRRVADQVRIEVWDTGIGISKDQLPHIFEEYYCGAERGGSGLGLAIVRRLGQILDHAVTVRSTPGKGTGFSIEVPRGCARVSAAEPVAAAQDRERFRGTVLVIEDETSVRAALRRMLTSMGIDVVGVASVSEAADLISHNGLRPDVVLCDYNLPGSMNGVESIMSLRTTLARDLPAIVMTGDTRSKTMESVASHGISLLVKPFLAAQLLQLLNRLRRS
jgi:PAS domain S-box-containing protein